MKADSIIKWFMPKEERFHELFEKDTQNLLRGARLFAQIATSSNLEDRRVKRFLADRARGCICPPDFPVCACGRSPEAELLFRRAVSASAGEVAQNPRARSARLRAAVKLETAEARS